MIAQSEIKLVLLYYYIYILRKLSRPTAVGMCVLKLRGIDTEGERMNDVTRVTAVSSIPVVAPRNK